MTYMLAMEKIYNNTLVKAVDEDRIDLISKMANELTPLVEQETLCLGPAIPALHSVLLLHRPDRMN